MHFRYTVLVYSVNGLDLMGRHPIRAISDSARGRSFQELQDFAAEMFNNEPAIAESYTGDSWTAEFMEYGCYCNKFVRGGGRVESDDVHENLCLELYACYKCIGIDYDTGEYGKGAYASTEISYNAEITNGNEFMCKDSAANYITSLYAATDNMTRHVCECDKNFVTKALENKKKCSNGENEYCLNDTYRFSNGWVSDENCKDQGMNQGANHDACCGTYPDRRAYDSERLLCCDGKLTASTFC